MSPAPAAPDDLDWMFALNQRHAVELSDMDRAAFADLVFTARHALVVQPEAAFLIACGPEAAYQSPNFRWFQARFEQFLYVDRVAVSPAHRRRGLARTLYSAVFDRARAEQAGHVVAEVNSDPPNPASDTFHEELGFTEVGTARLDGPGKTVRYLACPVGPQT